MFSKLLCIILILFSPSVFASWGSSKNIFDKAKRSQKHYLLVNELIESGFYYSAIPLMKEYLVKDTKLLSRKIENNFSKLIEEVGIKQFESLPSRYLSRSKSQNIRYILGKKAYNDGDLTKAINYLKNISAGHVIYPYAKNLEGVIYSQKNDFTSARLSFENCVKYSSGTREKLRKNRDYCIAGLARVKFAQKQHEESDLLYLDLPKSSSVWPEILFEEAWNSYYLKNYNRTLGKLVSYKAPVFSHLFNPEVEVLTALSYLKLCLYQDAKAVSDKFHSQHWNDFLGLNKLLKRKRRGTDYYFDLVISYQQFGKAPNDLMLKLLKSISKEPAFVDLRKQYNRAANEFSVARNYRGSTFKKFTLTNIQETLESYKNLIGHFTRARLVNFYAQMYKAFEGMTYIKLETLAQRKAKLYSFEDNSRGRGDIKYIQRNEKQYFWDFNGEFWADELGDYVFALKSEC